MSLTRRHAVSGRHITTHNSSSTIVSSKCSAAPEQGRTCLLPVSIQHQPSSHHQRFPHQHNSSNSVATAVISHNISSNSSGNSNSRLLEEHSILDDDENMIDIKPSVAALGSHHTIEVVYPEIAYNIGHQVPHEKLGAIEIVDHGGAAVAAINANNQFLDTVSVSSIGNGGGGQHVVTAGSGEYKPKMYPCQECHKVFRHPMSLHHHRHVHKGTYTCDSCGKVFSRRWDLHRHIHRSKMGCRRPNNNVVTSNATIDPPHSILHSPHILSNTTANDNIAATTTLTTGNTSSTTGDRQHCEDFTVDLNNSPSN